MDINYPRIHKDLGIVNCMPSMWLLNKHVVPELSIPFKEITAVDLGIIMTIGQLGMIPVIRQSYMIWWQLSDSTTHSMHGTPEWGQAIRAQVELAKQLYPPIFKYVWE